MKSRFDAVLKPSSASTHDVISLREAAALTRVSRAILVKLMESGELPGGKFGSVWKIPKKEFLDAFQKRLRGAYKEQNEK